MPKIFQLVKEGAMRLDQASKEAIAQRAENEEITLWIVGACCQEVFVLDEEDHRIKIIGNDPFATMNTITIPDMYAFFGYYLNVMDGIGSTDDIDYVRKPSYSFGWRIDSKPIPYWVITYGTCGS